MIRSVFGARGQLVVGVAAFLVAAGAWAYWTLVAPPTVGVVFHVSMFFGLVACYSIVTTALGYRATERVETAVVENIEQVDNVEVNGESKKTPR